LELQVGAVAAVREDHFHFDGVDYFRGRAAAVQIGDVGERKSPAGSHSHLAAYARLPRDRLAIERVTRIDLDGVTVRGSDVAVDITVAEVGSLGASTVARLLHDKTLCLLKLEAAPRCVIDSANECTGPRDVLSRAGKAGRLVHQVFVIVETATARDLTQATRWSLSGNNDDCVLTGIGAGGLRSIVLLAPGATFAYLLLRPTWRGKCIADAECDPWSRL
jgi:hypothetical protein